MKKFKGNESLDNRTRALGGTGGAGGAFGADCTTQLMGTSAKAMDLAVLRTRDCSACLADPFLQEVVVEGQLNLARLYETRPGAWHED